MSWVLTLFGTAVGAGILFLPITASTGGAVALIVLSVIIGPLTFMTHRGLARIVLATDRANADLPEAVEAELGRRAGVGVTWIYFLSILTICLTYGVAITNTVDNLCAQEFGWHLPRSLLAALLVGAMVLVIVGGEALMVRVSAMLVLPLILALVSLSFMLVGHWDVSHLHLGASPSEVGWGVLALLPLFVFSTNFSPVVSTFAVAYREHEPELLKCERRTSRILMATVFLLVAFVLFLVWSVLLALPAEVLRDAGEHNLSAMTALREVLGTGLVGWLSTGIALIAIITSFFGHFCGAREGLVALLSRGARHDANRQRDSLPLSAPLSLARATLAPQSSQERAARRIDRMALLGLSVMIWGVGVWNPKILNLVQLTVAPLIAAILYLLPVYAIRKAPQLARYQSWWDWVVALAGIVTLAGYAVGELVKALN